MLSSDRIAVAVEPSSPDSAGSPMASRQRLARPNLFGSSYTVSTRLQSKARGSDAGESILPPWTMAPA
jgi:hypothetical protein